MKYPILLFVLSLISVLVCYALLSAQPPGMPEEPGQAPIDGGLGILAALGGAYAIKKLRDRRKE